MIALAFTFALGCSTSPKTPGEKADLHDQVQTTLNKFEREDPSLSQLLDDAYGYAVFPTVGKGGAGVGGAFGRGELYEQGERVGFCSLSQGTVGLQLGGQSYSELIVFQHADALQRFKNGNLEFAAQASAVAATEGASANADYENGVLVFTMAKGGLMYEASIGGQKFNYEPMP